jgi:multiple sugar transport system ATP-binding protein
MKRLPKALSGGQRQRVALGRAIVREPAVFLFDEPLSNLDAKMRVEMRAEIIRLHNRLGATMIYVTHDQTEAMTMGERIVVMNEGRVQQVARPLDLYEKPANEFVAGFIGTPPMNIFPAGVFSGRKTGLRPEHIAIAEDGSGGLEAEVDFVESLGSETLVHVIFRGIPTIVRLQVFAEYQPGEKVHLRPDLSRMVEFA